MSLVEFVRPGEVVDFQTLHRFLHQHFGCGVGIGDRKHLAREVTRFFDENPEATYEAFVKAAAWAKRNRRRIKKAFQIVKITEGCIKNGDIPELDPEYLRTKKLEEAIIAALGIETDEWWRKRLICAAGQAREAALQEWQEERGRKAS